MRFWWVNHKKTARHEVAGNYLWSPQREANGARSQFYDNMRIAAPGDRVLSYSDGTIRYLGVVLDYACPAFKPESFGKTADNWSNDGWLLPVWWEAFSTPIRPKSLISSLGPVLPKKYSPIRSDTGNGNQKAYLAEIGQHAFDVVLSGAIAPSLTNIDISADAPVQAIDDAIQRKILGDPELDSTTKHQLIMARRGQGIFRSRVSFLEKSCRLTAIDNPQLLVASHIKPWRLCTNAKERLDGANGLLLAPHVDRLFDRGLISFDDKGNVLVSSRLPWEDIKRLGLFDACQQNCGHFDHNQKAYLAFHRAEVFLI